MSQISAGEWLNYSVDVSESGWYDFEFQYSASQQGSIGAQWADADTALFEHLVLPVSSALATISRVWLVEGEHLLRLNFESTAIFHLDNIQISEVSSASLNSSSASQLSVYPNPTQGPVFLNKSTSWEVYSVAGQLIKSDYGGIVDLSNSPNGIYIIHTTEGMTKVIKKN